MHVDDFFMTSESDRALEEAKRMLLQAFDKVTFTDAPPLAHLQGAHNTYTHAQGEL